MKLRFLFAAGFLCFVFSGGSALGATTNAPLNYQEVYQLLRENLHGMNEAALDAAAAEGLIKQLAGKVRLLESEMATNATVKGPASVEAKVFDGAFGYIRVGSVVPEAAKQLGDAYQGLTSTNRLKGIVVDLRYAGGEDYGAAALLADRFVATEQPLVDFGDGLKKSTAKTNAVVLPVAILVNNKTSSAAEVLAGILRAAEVGLLLGARTAGDASVGKEFPLKTGQRLLIATAPIKVGDGEVLAAGGITPDIQVTVKPDDELAHFKDPFLAMGKSDQVAGVEADGSSTNRVPRRRLNEAELVRMMREGLNPEAEAPVPGAREAVPARTLVRDPVLARAIDLLKGLAVVQQFRSI